MKEVVSAHQPPEDIAATAKVDGQHAPRRRTTPMLFWPKSLSAPCGAGKSTVAIAAIKEGLGRTNFLLVLPTIDLIEEMAARLKEHEIECVKVHSEAQQNVGAVLAEMIEEGPEVGRVVLTTWKSYSVMRWSPTRRNWKIFVDEVPQVDTFFPFTFPRNDDLLLKHIEVKKCRIPGVLLVKAKSQKALTKHLEAKRDSGETDIRELLLHVASPAHFVFVDEDRWNWFTDQSPAPEGEDEDQVYFVSMLNFEPFHGVTVLAANLEHSMLARWFEKAYRGQWRFRPDVQLAGGLSYTQHDFAHRAQVHHFPGRSFSKTRRDAVGVDGQQHARIMDRVVLEFFGDRKFGYVVNNDYRSPDLRNAANAIKIKVMSHGQNGFRDLTGIYVAAALNRPPAHMDLLRKLGFTTEEIRIATAVETYYQCIMRTNLRVPDSDLVVDIILPDKTTAEQIAKILGAPKPVEIGKGALGHKERLSQVQMNQRSKMKKWYQAQHEKWLGDPLKNKGKPNHLCFTLSSTLSSTDADDFGTLEMPVSEFVKFMCRKAKHPATSKKGVGLFNSAVYIEGRSYGYRRLDNIRYTYFLILDFDNGKLSKDDFVSVFGPDAPEEDRLSFIICNTHSRCPEKPNKFRVMVFFRHPATLEQHRAAHDYVLSVLKDRGWDRADLALDIASRNPNAIFFQPCTNTEYPEFAFFEAHNTGPEAFKLNALVPELLKTELETARIAPPKPVRGQAAAIPQEHIEAILAPLRGLTEGRDEPFKDAATKLAGLRHGKARLSAPEIEGYLRSVAGNELKIHQKIDRLMQFLQRVGMV